MAAARVPPRVAARRDARERPVVWAPTQACILPAPVLTTDFADDCTAARRLPPDARTGFETRLVVRSPGFLDDRALWV